MSSWLNYEGNEQHEIETYDNVHSLVHVKHDSVLINDGDGTDSTLREDVYNVEDARFHRRSREREEAI